MKIEDVKKDINDFLKQIQENTVKERARSPQRGNKKYIGKHNQTREETEQNHPVPKNGNNKEITKGDNPRDRILPQSKRLLKESPGKWFQETSWSSHSNIQ